jgi:ABC-2 type transport system permease protein
MFRLLRSLFRRIKHRAGAPAGPTRNQNAGVRRTGRPGALALVLHQARFDLLAYLRNRQSIFFTSLLPLMFLVIFVSIFGNRTVGPQYVKSSTYYVPGLSAMALIAASFVNLVISITIQRESGVLKRRRATPVPAWVLITGRTLIATLVGLVVMAALLLIGRFAYGVRLPSSTIPGVLLTAIVGSLCFCCLAYALSSVIGSTDAAQPIVQAITLPLYFISGVFIPNVDLPGWLRDVATFFPVQHLTDGLHHAYDPGVTGSGIVWRDLAVLGLWAGAGLAIALRRFVWTPAAAGV